MESGEFDATSFHRSFAQELQRASPSCSSADALTTPPWSAFAAVRQPITAQLDTWMTRFESVQWLLCASKRRTPGSSRARSPPMTDPASVISEFTPCFCVSGKTGIGKTSYLQELFKNRGYTVLQAADLQPQDQKEMFLRRLAQTLMQERTVVILDDTETITNSQLLPIVAFLRKCRKLMHSQLDELRAHLTTARGHTLADQLSTWKSRVVDPENILEGMRMSAMVVFVCNDVAYLQARLLPLHALCEHVYLPPLCVQDMQRSLEDTQTKLPLADDVALYCMGQSRGNWHRFQMMCSWCTMHQVSHSMPMVQQELERVAQYDDLYSRDRVLRQLFALDNPSAGLLGEMEVERHLDILAWENQWTLMFPGTVARSGVQRESHAAWAHELSLLDYLETRMGVHDTDHEDVSFEVLETLACSSSSCSTLLPGDNDPSTVMDLNSTAPCSLSMFEEQLMEYTAAWMLALVRSQQKHQQNTLPRSTATAQHSGGPSSSLLSAGKMKTKRKHERTLENQMKRGEQVCYAPSLWNDHLTKQNVVQYFLHRLLYGEHTSYHPGVSMSGYWTQCELLRHMVEYQYVQFCTSQRQRQSAYTKKIVQFQDLPVEVQQCLRRYGVEPNHGRTEGTYYFFFKFPGFSPHATETTLTRSSSAVTPTASAATKHAVAHEPAPATKKQKLDGTKGGGRGKIKSSQGTV